MHRRASKLDGLMERKLLADMRGYVPGQRFGIPFVRVPREKRPSQIRPDRRV